MSGAPAAEMPFSAGMRRRWRSKNSGFVLRIAHPAEIPSTAGDSIVSSGWLWDTQMTIRTGDMYSKANTLGERRSSSEIIIHRGMSLTIDYIWFFFHYVKGAISFYKVLFKIYTELEGKIPKKIFILSHSYSNIQKYIMLIQQNSNWTISKHIFV